MQTGTAVGLMVGGAVLLLAVSKPRVAAPGAAQLPAGGAYPGGAVNPFNWFSQLQPQQQQPFPSIPAPQPGGFQYGQGFAPNGYQNAGYSPSYSGYSPAASNPYAGVTTPPTAGMSDAYYANGGSPSTTGGGFQEAAYSQAVTPAGGDMGYWV